VIAANHDIDIVPIYLSGTHEAMPPGQNWPRRIPGEFLSRRHQVEVRFGQPIRPRSVEDRHEAMESVREFWDRKGLPASPKPAAPSRFERPSARPPAPAGDRSTTPA
jgi:1-acyl-sn-glycerol-3-phosphate acyltransferase